MSIEAMKLALEALESITDYDKLYAARVALRTAIQQAESEPVARPAWWMRETPEGIEWADVEPWIDGYTPLYTHPAPSVQGDVVRDAERWRTFLATRPSNTHEVVNDAIDAAMLAASDAQPIS